VLFGGAGALWALAGNEAKSAQAANASVAVKDLEREAAEERATFIADLD
jgi:hypothetical protein